METTYAVDVVPYENGRGMASGPLLIAVTDMCGLFCVFGDANLVLEKGLP
jgi:hypothetical protein